MSVGPSDQKLLSLVVLASFGVVDDVNTLLPLYVEAVINEYF